MEADRTDGVLTDYRDILTNGNLAQFLATQNWTCQQDLGYSQVWMFPEKIGGRNRILHLPRDASLEDYSRRLFEAVSDIRKFYGWSTAAVAEQVAAVHADLFFVRLDQSSADGTIPLRQASSLLESIDQMVRSAALTAYSPSSTGQGRAPDFVSDFLKNNVRMGHTKRGSFIITVATRMDYSPKDVGGSKPNEIAEAVAVPEGTKGTYAREVMSSLSRGLEVTRQSVSTAGKRPNFEDAFASGMKLPLVKALNSLGTAEGLRGIDMSFEWSTLVPVHKNVTNEIRLSRPSLEALTSVVERLQTRVEPRQEQIIGFVSASKWSENRDNEESSGEVVIQTEIQGRPARVTVPLTGAAYDWAIRAHRARLPFTVSGTLERTGRGWRFHEPISADVAFLERALGKD